MVVLALDTSPNVGPLGSCLTGDRGSGPIVEDTLCSRGVQPEPKGKPPTLRAFRLPI